MGKIMLCCTMAIGLVLSGCMPEEPERLTPLTIGNQVWSGENLNINTPGSWCIADCGLSGRFYTWEAAMHLADSLEGWKMPSDGDWRALEYLLGSKADEDTYANRTGGSKLKSYPCFNVFPGCYWLGKHRWQGERIVFWSSDTIHYQGKVLAKCRMLSDGGPKNDLIYNSYNLVEDSIGLSVRLIRE